MREKTPRFLIGHGERLTREEPYVPGPKPAKSPPYAEEETRARLTSKLDRVLAAAKALPASALPDGRLVAMVSLHPEFLAKSYFPSTLFGELGLRAVGSRARKIEPEKWSKPRKAGQSEASETIELYLAGRTDGFENWIDRLRAGGVSDKFIAESGRVEDLRPIQDLNAEGRLGQGMETEGELVLEAALHAPEDLHRVLIDAFKRHAHSLRARIHEEAIVGVPGMLFIPLRVDGAAVENLADFTFLRILRPVANLRPLPVPGITRSLGRPFTPPHAPPLNPSIRVAVLDGGLPSDHGLHHVRDFNTPGVGAAHPGLLDHGMAVTGALHWGCLNGSLGEPFGSIDHFRVLDAQDVSAPGDVHAYQVLRRIQDVLETGAHDLCNLSLGPDLSVDDNEVHAWTSTLDALCADGSRLIIAAAGNNGERPSPLCRVQVPGDGVNCLCVGAIEESEDGWQRASYSAIGPGRRPGIVKPDLVAFGGGGDRPFGVLFKRGSLYSIQDQVGTSFAAPLVTRAALSLRSMFSSALQPLTLKCLLIHAADPGEHHPEEVGWGRIPTELELPLCPDESARVVYQGTLPPKQLLRARIPVPPGLDGRIRITATLCYATDIRASDPMNYTNSGVEIVYRPNCMVFGTNADTGEPTRNAKTASFFQNNNYANEEERRSRHRKWETVLHASKRVDARRLKDPVFDLHFIPRLGPMDDARATPIRYAMVITLHASKYPDLYERTLAAFPELQAMTPVVTPVQVQT